MESKNYYFNKKRYLLVLAFFAAAFLYLLYASIQYYEASLTGNFAELGRHHDLAPFGLVLIAITLFFLARPLFIRGPAIRLSDEGFFMVRVDKKLTIPWENVTKIEIDDQALPMAPGIELRNFVLIKHQNAGKREEVWVNPANYSTTAQALKEELATFWETYKN